MHSLLQYYKLTLWTTINGCLIIINSNEDFLLQDSVHCALDVSRLQLEDWKSQGPRAREEALTQKALLQEELVTIRARMCDVSLVCNELEGRGPK